MVTAALAVSVAAIVLRLQKASPVSPALIDYGPLPTTGVWTSDFSLRGMERFGVGCQGPEDIAFDKHGRLYAGCADGWIKRAGADGKFANFSFVGGRPLGLDIGGDPQVLYVADAILVINTGGFIHLQELFLRSSGCQSVWRRNRTSSCVLFPRSGSET